MAKVEPLSSHSDPASQPGAVLTSCDEPSVQSATPSQPSFHTDAEQPCTTVQMRHHGESVETPRHKIYDVPSTSIRHQFQRAQSVPNFGECPVEMTIVGHIRTCRSANNMLDASDETGSESSFVQTRRPLRETERRPNVIIMHTGDDIRLGREMTKLVSKICKSRKAKAEVLSWDKFCPGGKNVKTVEEKLLEEPSVLVFCVTNGFMQGYRDYQSQQQRTVTSVMFHIMERALQSQNHYVIPVKSSSSPDLTEARISEAFPLIRFISEDDREFPGQIIDSLREAGVQVCEANVRRSWSSWMPKLRNK